MLTYLLIGINVLVSLIGFSRMNSVAGHSMFLFSPSEVSAGRNYQGMLLSHFAHADGTHLLFNMLTLYSFGPVVELGLGALSMLLIYVSAGIFSTLFVYYLHRADPRYRALGASDSVTGIIFAAIVLQAGLGIGGAVKPALVVGVSKLQSAPVEWPISSRGFSPRSFVVL